MSRGEPGADGSIRPGGLKVVARAWPPGAPVEDPALLEIVLTEFVDPSGIATHLRVPSDARVVEDELLGED